jgi:hypothetical protein
MVEETRCHMYPSRFLRINTQIQVAYTMAYIASREEAHMIRFAIVREWDKLVIPYKKKKRGCNYGKPQQHCQFLHSNGMVASHQEYNCNYF